MRETEEMPAESTVSSEDRSSRSLLVSRALRLEYLSIVWGVASAAWSVTAGLLAGSLGVLGLGLNVAADVIGSASLVWRFRVERSDPDAAPRAEARASLVVAAGLVVVAAFLASESVRVLVVGSTPGKSVSAMISAGAAAVVLTPLGVAKHRVGSAVDSPAMKGDGTLSGIGAGLGGLALLGLVFDRYLGWWWADRVAALVAAVLAAAEAVRVLRSRPVLPERG
jgi:divalent metal cation (Fe/Co/Zn/Cd) transporter